MSRLPLGAPARCSSPRKGWRATSPVCAFWGKPQGIEPGTK